MVRLVVAGALAAALAGLAAWLILTNAYPDEGPWLPISAHHGIHIGDVVIIVIWGTVVLVLRRWVRSGLRRDR